ncbi:PTS sugar transporter subunit IIA [Ruicaihuangia caeni]|uniref:Ascorbate-specific PTS system EIIA component n=1 Tax=Ruicaihuangia caeni TaxID=3042517 RepID=A0AAW6T6E2_9MICO|nr:PTS sugar transporter subunit IIA [Klugiella sp. YN-L-19]MDI2099352.1 PTS sugar transporter subunit IIA [Klugiella sp. YN-L-19]
MPLPALPERAIVIGARVRDWRAAVTRAGDALQRAGVTRASYTQRMVRTVEDHGAYIVIAPGLALAHARPGRDVLTEGLSVVTLAEPVSFGHPYNDPVRVVLGLAVRSPERHISAVAELANVFNDESVIASIAAAERPADVRALLRS